MESNIQENEPILNNLQNVIEILPNKIIEGLYLGSANESEDKKNLKSLGIKYILTIGTALECHFPKDFKYFKIDLEDHPEEPIEQFFQQSFLYRVFNLAS
jgi:hypothetical protein